jgi:pyrroline-5-carboxylate reductase
MLSEPDADSVELRRRVTSPGGTTQAGLTALEERGFASAVKEAVRRAAERAAELAEENS